MTFLKNYLPRDKRLNLNKCVCQPTRTGKTYSMIEAIPTLANLGCKVIFLTAPLKDIINQNQKHFKRIAMKNNIYDVHPDEILEYYNQGETVACYLTNSAFTSSKIRKIIKKIGADKFAVLNDEGHYGSTSGKENLIDVKGYVCDQFKATLYKQMSIIAKESPYTYTFTATPSFEFEEYLDTVGNLDYKIVFDMKAGEQKQYAERVAWAGKCYFYERNPLGKDDTFNAMSKMFTVGTNIETYTNHKRTFIIQVQDNDEDYNSEKIVNEISINPKLQKPFLDIVNDNDWIGVSISSAESFYFNLRGEKKNINEKDIKNVYTELDNSDNPLRILLVKQMGSLGVTIKTVKECMSLRPSEPNSKFGWITDSIQQFFSRTKTPYFGSVSVNDLYEKYNASCTNIPDELFSDSIINTYNVYLIDNKRNRSAWENHLKYDACTPDMIQEDCEHCNGTGKKNKFMELV